MSTGTNHWKLGLFVLIGAALAVGTAVWLGASRWREDVVEYTSYFDESVQGLDVGSPVKFRGVDIGRVTSLGVAPDQRNVAVNFAILVDKVERFHLGASVSGKAEDTVFLVHTNMRAQLAQTGITGVKFVLLDYFNDSSVGPQPLSFPLPPRYVPSVPSTLKQLENSVMNVSDQLPEIARQLSMTLQSVNRIVTQAEQANLPDRLASTLDQASLTMRQINQQLTALDAAGVSKELRNTMGSANATIQHIDAIVQQVGAENGMLQSMQGSINSIGEVARRAQDVGPELRTTLKDVRGAARSIRRLADTLETDPDMLLKGKAVAKSP